MHAHAPLKSNFIKRAFLKQREKKRSKQDVIWHITDVFRFIVKLAPQR
jgi:hypothetical protein